MRRGAYIGGKLVGMSVYLHDIPLDEAFARLEAGLIAAGLSGLLDSEKIPLDQRALGRVLAAPVWAKLCSPHYDAAAMDGFAVQSRDTDGASMTKPVVLENSSQAEYVDTGDPLPAGTNAVIPIEAVEPLDQAHNPAEDPRSPVYIRIRAGAAPWQHVRAMGEDIVATQLVLPAGHQLRPVDLGAIAGSGHADVVVACKPRVAILPTGSELAAIGEPVKVGEIIEYNSLVLAAQVEQWGGKATRFDIIADDFVELQEGVRQAAEQHDLILLNAGSSAGAEDFSAKVVETLGEMWVHGVAVRPGHPVILGIIPTQSGRQVPIIGVPGYPVSAALTGEIFVQPLMMRWLGRTMPVRPTVQATLTRKITSPPGDDDFVRVVVGRVGEKLLAAPLSRGAGVITSLMRADGLALLPRGSQGEPAGAKVSVQLYRPMDEIEGSIFAIGSHDITLDLIAQLLAPMGRRLVSANVGSLGGLMALRSGSAHLAGAHLLDPESGEYNLSYIQRYLPGTAVNVIGLVGRQQGLILAKGNPKDIRTLSDLARQDVNFANRQRGAGTRVLLDYHLKQMGLSPETIAGYNLEEYTHLGVAAAVASGRADCGLGIAAAAQALDLDFVPLFDERYDLIVPSEHYAGAVLAPLWELLQGTELREAIDALPGYDTAPLGKLIAQAV